MEWVASTLHTTSEHGVSSITTADAHTSAASSRLNWRPHPRFKWIRPFSWKTISGFCACAITFQMQSKIQRTEGFILSGLQPLVRPIPRILYFWHFIRCMSSRSSFCFVSEPTWNHNFSSSFRTKRTFWSGIWITYDVMMHVNRVMYDYCKIKFYSILFIHIARTNPAYRLSICVCFNTLRTDTQICVFNTVKLGTSASSP